MAEGYHLLADYAERTGIPVERTGALLVAWNPEERDALPGLRDKAARNGYHGCRIVDRDEVYRQVPALGPGALGGLTVPDESIIAHLDRVAGRGHRRGQPGVTLLRRHPVNRRRVGPGRGDGPARPGARWPRNWVVNAAGLCADRIDALFGHTGSPSHPAARSCRLRKLPRASCPRIVAAGATSRARACWSPHIYVQRVLGPTAQT